MNGPSPTAGLEGDARLLDAVEFSARRRSHLATLGDLVRLAKPRITVMVIATAFGGMWLATRAGAAPAGDWGRRFLSLVALALVVAGANALNMYLERDSDALMHRTRSRPLPARRLAPRAALAFGALVTLGALPVMWVAAGPLAAFLAAASFVVYVAVYTPLKRLTSTALVVGAVPGAMPPLIGWTSASGEIGWPGVVLFLVLFFWQMPHFIAIATFRADDYARAGIKVLPLERGDRAARVQALLYALALLVSSLVLVPLGVAGGGYLAGALLLGSVMVVVSARGLSPRALAPHGSMIWARALFAVSLFYLPLLIATLMVSA
jgi:protoheme IX farnesyltransferase